MKIEAVHADNLDQAVYVYEESWREVYQEACTPEFLVNRNCRGDLLQKLNGLFLISDGEPVGIFRLIEGEIADLYIHPMFRNRGYGSACIKYAMTKCDQLKLIVLSSNEGAIRLYKRMGFNFSNQGILLKIGTWEREK